MDTQSREKFLIHAMNSGFERAAASFSKLINKTVRITNSHYIIAHDGTDLSCISEEAGDLYILVTQIIGDIPGKSFLVFNQEESKEIFATLNMSSKNHELNEAFLLEIDNIISASVISNLSNALNIEIYGDVPKLLKVHSSEFQKVMLEEAKHEEPSAIIFANTTFSFQTHERIHPQFIWKLSAKIFDKVPETKLNTQVA